MDWLSDRRLLGIALVGWVASAAIGVVSGHPLGHDEAAYAALARDGNDVWIYRSDGMVAIARLGLLLGDGERPLRLVAAVLGLGALGAVVALGTVAFSARTGAWAGLILAGAHPVATRSSSLLSDLPSMACMVGGMAILIAELRRAEREGGGPRWRIVAVAPLWAAAFYVRYGSAPTVMILALLSIALWWPVMRRRPAPPLAMLALLGLLVAPHLLRSWWATGSPMGILEISAAVSGREYVGHGLVTYLTSNPFRYYGALVAPLMVLGLALPFVRPPAWARERARVVAYLALAAVAQLVVLGLQSHAEPRYVYLATSLLVLLGIELVRRSRWASRRWARAVALAVALLCCCWVVLRVRAYFQQMGENRAIVVDTARAMRAHAGTHPCAMIAWRTPQLVWYSRCAPVMDPQPPAADRYPYLYVVSFARQPMPPSSMPQPGQRACRLATPAGVELWQLNADCAHR
jgi:Dolichyl-phosphate-mannose-protein mannosyltransferase/Alg9-like mannosyltransferase family